MEKPNYKKASDEANELLKEYDIKEPVVPIFDIAKEEGIDLKFVKMPEGLENIAGFLNPKTKTMFINSNDAPNRQTFTVAHELGHYILKHEPKEYSVLLRMATLIQKNSLEKEANYFAASILVPFGMLKEIMKKYSLTELDTKALANIFGVSEEFIMYRLQSLKYDY